MSVRGVESFMGTGLGGHLGRTPHSFFLISKVGLRAWFKTERAETP